MQLDLSVTWRAALIQALAVAVLSIALALALPHSFFENWGWLAGPGAWIACSLLTVTVVDLPIARGLLGAVLAGIPSALAVLAGVHWLGAAVAVLCFGAWCGWIAVHPADPGRPAA